MSSKDWPTARRSTVVDVGKLKEDLWTLLQGDGAGSPTRVVDFQQALHRLPERMPPPAKPESISIAQAFYCLLHLANEPPALGTKWTNVGRERPASGTELFNEALSEALRKKHEFRKEEVEKFKVGLLKVDCFIKVGEEYFEEAGQRHAVELVGERGGLAVRLRDVARPTQPEMGTKPAAAKKGKAAK